MPVKLNILEAPNSESTFQIEGVPYKIRTTLNVRSGEDPLKGRWYIDISDKDNNTILGGIKVMPNQNLTWRFGRATRALFEGDLWCFDTQGNLKENEVTNGTFGVGKRYELWYYTKQEMLEDIN